MGHINQVQILLIEDSEDDALLMITELQEAGLQLNSQRVDNAKQLQQALQAKHWDIILSDYTMPTLNAIQVLTMIKAMNLDIPCLVVSGTIGEETAVAIMKAGAADFFMKGRLHRLPSAIERHIAEHAMRLERKKTDDKLRAMERRFQIMADCAPALIWMTDETGKYTFFNKGWLDFTGLSLEQAHGKGWVHGIHPDDYQYVMESYNHALKERLEFKLEYRLKRHDGEYRWLLDHGTPRFEEKNEFTGYIGSCMDITERIIAAAEREQAWRQEMLARQEAERLNRIKDEFLATLSHELRTPMHAITGWAELLTQQLLEPSETIEACAAIYQCALTQNQLISDLLDISAMISGKIALHANVLDLIKIINSCLDTVALSAEAKNITVKFHHEPKLGIVKGDSTRIKQVIWNILSNAIKFTPQDGTIEISIKRHNSNVEIEIKDNGEGIEPEFLPLVFDRFSQSDSSLKRRHGGLGIGLSIVRHLVELHGGQVKACSGGKGMGANFLIRLPILDLSQTKIKSPVTQKKSRIGSRIPIPIKHQKKLDRVKSSRE